eukprot:gene3658-4004_t
MENKAASHTPAALTLEQHLSYQFQYFKEQFLLAASSLGIAVPLDMMEDKSGHIFPFLQASGPKYIFQIMQSHIQNVHLMRCALSLLLITTSLLRKRIAQVDMDDGRLHRVHSTEKEWARQALQKFSDSVTMGSCVNILISTYNPVVQELVLNLMAALISSSNDTVRQMLSAPNSRFSSIAEVNHQKVLSLHLKKLNSRIFTADTTASENRRSILPPTNGMLLPVSVLANVHNNSAAYQSTSNLFEDRKLSFQRDRSNTVNNSRLSEMFDESTGPSASSGAPEEYNSCLANVLSVVLLQKNRHLLLAGCTDIIQAMARNGSSELCEIIARTPTCPLPLIDLDRNAASKKRQAKTTPINPLGSRIVEWAGLKIPLKFLQKFHTLFSVKDRKANLDGSEEEKALSYQASTSQIREEYCYAHDSSLLAIALLIKGSQAVMEHVLTLPGASDLLQLSVSHYAGRHNGEIDEVILNAVNVIQMEKQRQVRMRARESMLTVQTSSSSSASGGLPRPHPSAKSPVLPHMRRSRSQEATKYTSQSQKSLRPISTVPFSGDKATEDLAWAMSAIQPSPPRLVSQSQPLSLANGLEANFRAEYVEETEKGRLYLMKQADQVSKERGPPSDFTVQAAGQLRSTLQASIHHPPSVDNLLETSLRKIDANTEESILLQKKSSGQQDVPAYAEKLGLFPPQSLSTPGVPEVSFASYYNNGSQSSQSKMPESNSADAAGFLQHGLSASRDFFGHLPPKPFIPKRIEAKDCVHPTEDLDKIREKFRLIADNAVMKIKGEGVLRNGKNTVSIEERARRVYSPQKHQLPSLGGSQLMNTLASNKANESKPPRTASGGIKPLQPIQSNTTGLFPLSLDDPDLHPSLIQTRGDSEVLSTTSSWQEGSTVETEEQTPAWNSISTHAEQGYFGFKLDAVDLEEEGNALFDAFKPIFDYTPNSESPDNREKKKQGENVENRPNTVPGRVFEASVLANSAPMPSFETTEDPLI